jgi:hypothetical protein
MEYKGFSDAAREMQAQTAEFTTKADKIRALAKAGYKRQQIADFLGIRYQHVRNVLVDDERRAKHNPPQDASAAGAETKWSVRADSTPPKQSNRTVKVKVGPDGNVAVPPHMLEAFGWKEGETVWVHMEGAGELRLQDVHALTRMVQAYAREHLPNLGSVDDFLAWRREEAQREEQEIQVWLGDGPPEGQ